MIRARRSLTLVATVTVAAAPLGFPASAAAEEHSCPGLYVLGVQGTGQSSPDSPATEDTGLLATVLGPLVEQADGSIARAYVPYAASFGGAFPGATEPYSDSAEEGLGRLREMAAAVLDRCPATQLGLIGYSQGAHVVSMFASEVGHGSPAVPADRVAAVALLADPTRAPGAPLFPGLPGRDHPDPAPGTTGAELGAIPGFASRALPGGGIGPLRDIAADFGALTGRVASLCLPGDLACDAPADAPLLHMIVTILGQAELMPSDPLGVLNSISENLTATLARTAAAIVNQDLRGYSLGTLSLTPQKPLSVRLAEAADPRVDAEAEARQAILKLGTSTLNTLLAIIGVALKPEEVAAVAAAPTALDGLDRAATALLAGIRRPLPRRTVFNLVATTFDALGRLGADNAELLDPALWSRYADTVRRHGDYPTAGYTADGRPATGLVLSWFDAVATDLAVHRIPPAPSATAVPSGPGETLGSVVPSGRAAPLSSAGPSGSVPPHGFAEAPGSAEQPGAEAETAPALSGGDALDRESVSVRTDLVVAENPAREEEPRSPHGSGGLAAYLTGLGILASLTTCSVAAPWLARRRWYRNTVLARYRDG
ncbi:cutinase family protein [Nocardia takedensis]